MFGYVVLVLLCAICWMQYRLVKAADVVTPSLWQRRQAIDKVMAQYFSYRLQFPNVVRMIESGKINERPKSDYEFKEGDSFGEVFGALFGGPGLSDVEEAENEAWRNLTKLHIAQISRIYGVSRLDIPKRRSETFELSDLVGHADQSIATIVGRSWRSLDYFIEHYFPPETAIDSKSVTLEDLVSGLINTQKECEADLNSQDPECLEIPNA